MAPEKSSSPEKQLLNLIENPKAGGLDEKKIKKKALGSFSLAAVKSRFVFFKEKMSISAIAQSPFFDIHGFNNILKLSVIGLSLYLATLVTLSMNSSKRIPVIELDSGPRGAGGFSPETSLLKKVSFYLEKARMRDIFKFYEIIEEEEEVFYQVEEEKEPEIPFIDQVVGELKLVGIAWSDEPDAMVEDTTTKKIHFIKRGDFIGKVKVDAILKDRVIVSYEGDEREIR